MEPEIETELNEALAGEEEAEEEEETEVEDEDSAPSGGEAEDRVVELDYLTLRPGTYFNPQTEVLVVVDDSTSIDQEVFNMEPYEGAEWVRISDEVPVDEAVRDELMEQFQTHYHPGNVGSVSETALDMDDGEEDEGEEGQDPGRED